MKCRDCNTEDPAELKHQDEHPGICCDCLDLEWGMPLDLVNRERARKGKPLLKRREDAGEYKEP